jgi:Protein of unknown function (DUF3501)
VTANPLTLLEITDLRVYEQERDDFRRAVIAERKIRRVTVGPLVTLNFESRTTVRFQVQEMARAENLTTDDQIQHELDIYNRLLPSPGELSATLFLELTTEEQLRTWLPKLVGVEHSAVLLIGEGTGTRMVQSVPEEDHEVHLTRVDVTSAVHYVRFPFTPPEIAEFAAGPATLIINHVEYPDGRPGVLLSDATRAALTEDLASP